MPFTVAHSPEEWSAKFGADTRTVLTIGNFDGVHRGHQQIIKDVVERARREHRISAALTFWPHPLRVVRPEIAPPLIETLPQRLAHLEFLGLDAVFVLPFDHSVASLAPGDFVRHILVDTMRTRVVFVGENFRFGHRQAGNVQLLRELGRSMGDGLSFDVECVSPVILRGVIVSSSAIRAAVANGHMPQAARLLGRPFSLAGEIRTGTGTGRRFVFPTLNLSTEQELLPARGVYATETVVRGHTYRSATNVGVRPTFDGSKLAIESHLFDFSEEITSGQMEVRFWLRLRDEKKFSGPETLRAQIQQDISRARSFFARLDAARHLCGHW
ncbi:MAG TPA: bifunctional riboflavin kinase/FAD synthetase [Candidatus Acidoferrales bacterium]|nr:bifunctional riboflavin kinase/FAD synthetase [Candidatus Acidoferrales bacterium]